MSEVWGGARNEGSDRGNAGFLDAEPKNAWAGGKSRDGTRGGAGERGKLKFRNVYPQFQLLIFAALLARTSPAVSFYGLGELSLVGAQSLSLLLPSFSRSEKGSPRGDVGRDGVGEGTTGRGWRRREREGEEREEIFVQGRRRMGRRKSEWKGVQRLVNGGLKTGPPARRCEER